MKDSIISIKSLEFSKKVISCYKQLLLDKEYVLSKQFLKSGTSIGANIQEAYEAQSKKDFIHKMSIAFKESRETMYWIKLLGDADPSSCNYYDLTAHLEEIIKLLSSTIKTSKENLYKQTK